MTATALWLLLSSVESAVIYKIGRSDPYNQDTGRQVLSTWWIFKSKRAIEALLLFILCFIAGRRRTKGCVRRSPNPNPFDCFATHYCRCNSERPSVRPLYECFSITAQHLLLLLVLLDLLPIEPQHIIYVCAVCIYVCRQAGGNSNDVMFQSAL